MLLGYDSVQPSPAVFHQTPPDESVEMNRTCSYCKCLIESGEQKCKNCGGPVGPEDCIAEDYRHCPYCSRKLLALGSPACSFCGRRLPEDYVKAREADLRRIEGISEGSGDAEVNRKVDELIHETARRERGRSSLLDLLDLTDLL